MRILHVISSGGMYGAEAVILNLSRTLNRQDHTSMLGIFSNSANPNLQLHECALEEAIESHLIPCHGQVDRTVPASIRSLVLRTNADVVHAHGYKADVYAYLAMRELPTALVSTCHNWLDDNRLVHMYGAVDRWVLRRYDAIIAVSQQVKQRLVGSKVPSGKVHLVRNGIDLQPFIAASPSIRDRFQSHGGLLVGWVGRLSPEKGPDLFIQAAAKVRSEFPNARFILAGDGPARAELEALIQTLGLANSVQFIGRRNDMPEVYASVDVMVSSSRFEGLPMAILEGMASGRPWVATAVGDVPTVVRNGQTGLLVLPGDENLLANALAEMLRNHADRARMGAAAQHVVTTEFSAEGMVAEHLRIYASVARHKAEISSGMEHARRIH